MIDAPEQPAGEVAADDRPAALLGEILLPPETALPVIAPWQEGMTPREIAFTDEYFKQRFNASSTAA